MQILECSHYSCARSDISNDQTNMDQGVPKVIWTGQGQGQSETVRNRNRTKTKLNNSSLDTSKNPTNTLVSWYEN